MSDNRSSSLDQYASHYTVEAEVGRGGAGRVFLAYDGNIGREVAIKEIAMPPEVSDEVRERRLKRFIREAKVTGQLEHPGIVPVYDFGVKSDGTTYYVMKYVRGKTLTDVVKESRCDTCEEGVRKRLRALGCLIDVCEAMAYAHSKGVIHRDLKPGNIVLGEFGETIILDWGLAKKKGEEEAVSDAEETPSKDVFDEAITRHGAVLGTPSFMAPEQADSKFGPVDQQSDVYALGALLFYLLTGQRIYEPGGREALTRLTGDEPTPSPRQRVDCIPPELVAICEKATAKHKEDRFRDAGEMAEELRAYRDGRLVSVYAYSRRELFCRFLSRNKAAAIATMALIIAIVVGAGFSLNFAVDAQRARQRAERALVDITAISHQAMSIARTGAARLQAKFHNVSEAHATALVRTPEFISSILDFDPVASPFQVWVMNEDGRIVYDEDPHQVDKMLFTDAMYQKFPELLQFGKRMQAEPWGMGYYLFFDRAGEREIYKIAAWDTVKFSANVSWKMVVTHPYVVHK